MPENTLELTPESPNAAAHNAEVALKLSAQGEDMHKPLAVADAQAADEALEASRIEFIKRRTEAAAKKEEAAEDEVVAPAKEAAPEKPKDATVIEPAVEKIASAKTDDKPPAVPDKSSALGGPDDIFSGIALPPNIKPKSAEAFEKVKALGREQIAERDAKLAEMEKQIAELQAQTKNATAVPEELQKELEEHRTFRTKLDIEADPRFKAFDKDVTDTHNFIYAQLLKTGKITQANIDDIKKLGGPIPSKTNMARIFEEIADPSVQRIIESKIADVEMLQFKKEQAIAEKKNDVAGYLKEQEENFSKATGLHNDATKKEFSSLVAKMDWVKDRALPKDADATVKADVESHNKFVASTKKDLEVALHDDSPQMRAILLAGMGQLLNLQRVHEGVKGKLATVEKELADATAKLERFKSASKSRLPESSAPANAKPPEPKKDDLSITAGDSLEAARKAYLAQRTAQNV